MTQDTLPILPDSAGPRDTIVWLRSLTKWLGPGFHPDTSAADYVSRETGRSTFTSNEASRIDHDMDRARVLLAAQDRDPCAVAIKVQRRLLGFTVS